MDWKFTEIKYVRPDFKGYQDKLDAFVEQIRDVEDFEVVKKIIMEKSELESELTAMQTIAFCRAYHDISDSYYQEEVDFNSTSDDMLRKEEYARAIVESPFRNCIAETFGEQYIVLQEEILAAPKGNELKAKISMLENLYQQKKAQIKYNYQGKEVSEAVLLRELRSEQASVRRAAYEASLKGIVAHKAELEDILHQLVKKRNALARENGFDNFTEYGNQAQHRIGYGDKELFSFVEDVKKYIVPLYLRAQEEQRKNLGLDVLYPCDTQLYFSDGNAQRIEGEEPLTEAAKKMYHSLSPEAGIFFEKLQQHEVLDVASSEHKISGMGFMTELSGKWKMPYVFSNNNGTTKDVQVYIHELGHAYQAYLTMQYQMFEYYDSSPEYHEIHSKTMELLSHSYADLFFGEDAEKYLTEHKFTILKEMCTFSQYYAFERWLYQNEDATTEEWAEMFNSIAHAYGNGLYNEEWAEMIRNGAILLDSIVIFYMPFYTVGYVLAEVCALELYDTYCKDSVEGWKKYRDISLCGGSLSFPKQLQQAALSIPYSDGTVERAAKSLEKMISLYD